MASILGVFLVLKKISLIGDGLAHVTFGGTALSIYLFKTNSILFTTIVVVLSSIGILKITEKSKLGGDASVGIVSSLGIATAITLTSINKGYNIDLNSYLFGNILSISNEDVILALALFVILTLVIIFYYNEIVLVTLNEDLAKASGVKTAFINQILIISTAISVVLSMKLVGVMLITALLIIPAASTLQFSKSFKLTIIFSAIQALLSVVGGIFISFYTNVPTSAVIVFINLAIFLICYLYNKLSFKKL